MANSLIKSNVSQKIKFWKRTLFGIRNAIQWVSSSSSIDSNNILELHLTKTSISYFNNASIPPSLDSFDIDFIDWFYISNKNLIFCSFSTEMSHLIYADSDFIQSLQCNLYAIVSHVKCEIQSTMLRFVVQIAWNRCRWEILPFNRVCKPTHTQTQTYKHFVVIFD